MSHESRLLSHESPEGLVLLPLHVKHHINNVLQHLGAGNVPRFGHMAHQEDGDVVRLGNMQQGCGTLPHLWQRQMCFFKPDWTQAWQAPAPLSSMGR